MDPLPSGNLVNIIVRVCMQALVPPLVLGNFNLMNYVH